MRREPVDVKIIKKVYQPEVVKHVAPFAPVAQVAQVAPVKYYAPQQETVVAPVQKLFTPSVHQKIIAPVVKQYVTPQYYAAPEQPKFYAKPVERIAKIVKPGYEYEPHYAHTAVKYAAPAPQYNHY